MTFLKTASLGHLPEITPQEGIIMRVGLGEAEVQDLNLTLVGDLISTVTYIQSDLGPVPLQPLVPTPLGP